MKKNFQIIFFALLLMLVPSLAARAQSSSGDTEADIWSALPDSDFVVYVNVQRVVNEALPRIFAGDATRTKNFLSGLDEFKTFSGVDVRDISHVVIGGRASGLNFNAQDIVIIGEGSFNAPDLVNKLRSMPHNGEARQETHGKTTIFIYRPNSSAGGPPQKIPQGRLVAIATLATHLLVAGDPEAVKRAVDSFETGQGRMNADLVTRARSNPEALISLAARIPSTLKTVISPKENRLTRLISSIKQFQATLNMGTEAFPLVISWITETPDSASELRCMLESLRTLVEAFVPDPTAQQILDKLNITSEGNEVLMQTDISLEMIRSTIQPSPPPARPATPSAPASPSPSTRPSLSSSH